MMLHTTGSTASRSADNETFSFITSFSESKSQLGVGSGDMPCSRAFIDAIVRRWILPGMWLGRYVRSVTFGLSVTPPAGAQSAVQVAGASLGHPRTRGNHASRRGLSQIVPGRLSCPASSQFVTARQFRSSSASARPCQRELPSGFHARNRSWQQCESALDLLRIAQQLRSSNTEPLASYPIAPALVRFPRP